jgi:hypothetical protein
MSTDREPPGRSMGSTPSLPPVPPLDPVRAQQGGRGDGGMWSYPPVAIPFRFHPGTEEGIPWPEGDL